MSTRPVSPRIQHKIYCRHYERLLDFGVAFPTAHLSHQISWKLLPFFLFHAGKELVFGSFAWCNLLFVCKWRRWSDGNFELICGGTASVWNAALQLKAARYAGKAGKKARIFISRWRRSVWSLKTVLDTQILLENISLYNIYIYTYIFEDESSKTSLRVYVTKSWQN